MQQKQETPDSLKSKYKYTEAFANGFYSNAGSPTRSASGKPGHGYWQNQADYDIAVTLDASQNKIFGNETITYTNNSHDSLEFLWLQLDQNLFEDSSRGNAIIPIRGSRNGARGQNFDGGYKISAVPFHFWTPDVYEGSPTTITAYLSVAPKAAGFALLIRFFNQVFGDGTAMASESWMAVNNLPWPQLMAVLAAATMTVGNLVAIQQNSVKRMLAYSSIAHAGYMMMALPLMSQSGVYGIMVYIFVYLFMNLGAFFVLIYVQSEIGGETFNDFDGLGWKMPFLGIVMTLFMVSLTGLPPTAGFIGKFYIFASVIEAGPQYYWLVFVGVVNSVVSLYYYIRVVKHMYLVGERSESIGLPSSHLVTLVLIVLAIPTFVFGWYFNPLTDWINQSLVIFQGM